LNSEQIKNTENTGKKNDRLPLKAVLHTVYISVGSNMGDKPVNCQNGISGVTSAGTDTVLTAASEFYRTEPVDYLDQDWFVNAVIQVETSLDPMGLLNVTQRVQQQVGRKQGGMRFGPRVLDLDILFFDDLVLKSPELEIPHPRMHKRRFVLEPLCDINPFLVHPKIGKNMKTILDMLGEGHQEVIRYSS
jgi:2-amino-4-hydroxy-6-hydroxymethyldihydropteridine diphosphokinase